MIAILGCMALAALSHSVTKRELTYLALGDSYTIGESVPYEDRWPTRLVQLLRKSGKEVAAPVFVSRTGWTADELIREIHSIGDPNTYDLVTLLIGVNNQYRGLDIDLFRQNFKELLGIAAKFARGKKSHVVVVSIPNWGLVPFAKGRNAAQITAAIKHYNEVCAHETRAFGAQFVDISPLADKAAGDPSFVASDGLHYSGKMHQLWAEKVLPVAKKILSK